MRYRIFGRMGWQVGEIGYGMWGMGGWTDSDDHESLDALAAAVECGINFYDTAWEYGEGRSEQLLGQALRATAGASEDSARLLVATKVPPKTMVWPSHRGDLIADSFPRDHILEYVDKSLANLAVPSIDLLQFHVWEDAWADDEVWQATIAGLKDEGVIRAVGISLNRWEPWNSLRTLRTGLVDAVQVVYNIFDQAPEDELFPACAELGVAVIARVPLDEGSLAGILTPGSRWPEDDWRSTYFTPKNLAATLERVEALREVLPEGMSLPELALRFVLSDPNVSVVIPGMRKAERVRANIAACERGGLPADLLARLREHRWNRAGPEWQAEAEA